MEFEEYKQYIKETIENQWTAEEESVIFVSFPNGHMCPIRFTATADACKKFVESGIDAVDVHFTPISQSIIYRVFIS